jgi:hypothetical protein
MAKVVEPIKDFMTKLRALPVVNGDGNAFVPVVRIWNDQLRKVEEGTYPAFPSPAFFVEIVNNAVYQNIGQEFRAADLSFRVHIVHFYLDAQDGTFEQDLVVFTLRDILIQYLTGVTLSGCGGGLEAIAEGQDYGHGNMYHYLVDFVCNFIDSTGSRFDPTHPNAYIDGPNPTALTASFTIQH